MADQLKNPAIDEGEAAQAPSASSNGRLNSWKEVAAYLGRDVRTVQRWEESEGLPIHRVAHKRQGTIYAHQAELDAWRLSDRRPSSKEVADDAASPTGEPAEPAAATPACVESAAPAQPHHQKVWRTGLAIGALALLTTAVVWLRWPHRAAATIVNAVATDSGRLFALATSEGHQSRLIGVGAWPESVVITPDGHEIYVKLTTAATP